jgi:hypothetical protein
VYTPPKGVVDPKIDMKTPPIDQVSRMSAAAFFTYLAALMKSNPPSAADAPVLAKLARIGIVPGQDFEMSKLGSAAPARNKEKSEDTLMGATLYYRTSFDEAFRIQRHTFAIPSTSSQAASGLVSRRRQRPAGASISRRLRSSRCAPTGSGCSRKAILTGWSSVTLRAGRFENRI